ncbi:MAG: hypothetical protein IJ775_07525, partial [Muribaculaceae bacterium]|nr:hypothetical protein [Muribaculaceae bacterium]
MKHFFSILLTASALTATAQTYYTAGTDTTRQTPSTDATSIVTESTVSQKQMSNPLEAINGR